MSTVAAVGTIVNRCLAAGALDGVRGVEVRGRGCCGFEATAVLVVDAVAAGIAAAIVADGGSRSGAGKQLPDNFDSGPLPVRIRGFQIQLEACELAWL